MARSRTSYVALALAIALVVLVPGMTGSAWSASAVLTARANVLPWATLKAERHVNEYIVTSEDIARGYVVVRSAATLYIRTNASRLVTIRTTSTGDKAVYLAGPGGQYNPYLNIDINTDSSVKQVKKTVDYRIDLPEDTRSGRYQLAAALDIESF